MSFFNNLFKKNTHINNNSKCYNYQDDLKEWHEYNNKYLPIWNLAGEYTEKINYYYYNFINNNFNKNDFNNLLTYCQKYIQLLPNLEEAKREDERINGTNHQNKPYCIAYHRLAMAYEKVECYNSAINVCNEAVSKGYTDGTKGGFENRIQRLIKKQAELKK